MVKINLLPKTINQKRVLRNTAIMFAFLLVLVIVAGVAYGMKLKGDVANMEAMAADAEQRKSEVEAIQQKAQQVAASIQPIQQKLDFINSVLDYNLKYPKLYEEIAKWTYEKVSLDSLGCDGQQVVMLARVKTLDDLGRYLLNMYRASDLFTEVIISGIPGYGGSAAQGPGGPGMGGGGGEIGGSMASLAGIQAIESSVVRTAAGVYAGGWISFTVTCKLKTPIVAPQFAGAAQPAGAAGMPAAPVTPGMAPGMPNPGGMTPGG